MERDRLSKRLRYKTCYDWVFHGRNPQTEALSLAEHVEGKKYRDAVAQKFSNWKEGFSTCPDYKKNSYDQFIKYNAGKK